MRKILATLLTFLICAFTVSGYTTYLFAAPAEYLTSTSTGINFSGQINSSGVAGLDEGEVVNVTVMNKSSSSGSYGFLDATASSVVNASGELWEDEFWNITATLTEERHWIKLNFTNSTEGGTVTSEAIIDIDTDYYVLTVGQFDKINLSLDTGHINTTGIVAAAAFRLANDNHTNVSVVCDADRYGMIRYNSTVPYFFGCTPDGWLNFTGGNT